MKSTSDEKWKKNRKLKNRRLTDINHIAALN